MLTPGMQQLKDVIAKTVNAPIPTFEETFHNQHGIEVHVTATETTMPNTENQVAIHVVVEWFNTLDSRWYVHREEWQMLADKINETGLHWIDSRIERINHICQNIEPINPIALMRDEIPCTLVERTFHPDTGVRLYIPQTLKAQSVLHYLARKGSPGFFLVRRLMTIAFREDDHFVGVTCTEDLERLEVIMRVNGQNRRYTCPLPRTQITDSLLATSEIVFQ